MTAIDEKEGVTIIASGPLTSGCGWLPRLRGLAREESTPERASRPLSHDRAGHNTSLQNPRLYFYDSISPIVEADSIDMGRVYMAARYDKGSADYINCPMTPQEYDNF